MKLIYLPFFVFAAIAVFPTHQVRAEDPSNDTDTLLTENAARKLKETPGIEFPLFLQNGRPHVFRTTLHHVSKSPIELTEQRELKKAALMKLALEKFVTMMKNMSPPQIFAGIKLSDAPEPRMRKRSDGTYSMLCDVKGHLLLMP